MHSYSLHRKYARHIHGLNKKANCQITVVNFKFHSVFSICDISDYAFFLNGVVSNRSSALHTQEASATQMSFTWFEGNGRDLEEFVHLY